MSTSPLFSVIVPTYNRANLLKKAVQSVLDQTFQDWELIIVDDGSTDGTTDTIKGFSDSRIRYIFQEHQERSTARNLGITHALGRYICFMDDDDYLLNNHLQVFYEKILEDNFPVKIYRNGFYFEKGEKRMDGPMYDIHLHHNPVYFAAFYFCSSCTLCIPKTCLDNNIFPQGFPYWEDTHLIMRLLEKYDFQQNTKSTYIYRQHTNRGSQLNYRDPKVSDKVELNVNAMRHLFLIHGSDFRHTLPPWTKDFLISEKYLEYANNALPQRAWGKSFTFFIKSIRKPVFRMLIWQYLKYLIKVANKFLFNIPRE